MKGRPKGAINLVQRDARAMAQAILENPEYRKSLKRRLYAGKAPHMEVLLHHYAWGQPLKQIAVIVDDRRDQFKGMTDHDLHVRAAELGGELNGQVH